MTISDRLLQASFRGFSYLVPRETETAGRKVAVHEYPGSDERFVQDLGSLQPTFSQTCIIHGFDDDQQRLRFSQVLDRPGPGILVHPYLGRILAIPLRRSVITSDRALGEVVFDVEFMQTERPLSLFGNTGGIDAVFTGADRARGALDNAFNCRFISLLIAVSFVTVGNRVREGVAVVQGLVSTVVSPVSEALNDVNRTFQLVNSDILNLARTPERLTGDFRSMFDNMLALGDTPSALADQWQRLTNFGSPQRPLPRGQLSQTLGSVRLPITRSTQKRRDEDDNLRVLDQYLRIEALINLFEALAEKDYETDEDLFNARAQLADDFDRIIQNQDDITATSNLGDEVLTDENVILENEVVSEAIAFSDSLAFDPDLRASIEDLRVSTFDVLNEDTKNPARVQDFDLGVVDIQIAAHQLYGDQDQVDQLISLNREQNPGFLREAIKGFVL